MAEPNLLDRVPKPTIEGVRLLEIKDIAVQSRNYKTLVIGCSEERFKDIDNIPGLKKYLVGIKPILKEMGVEGIAFVMDNKNK